MSEHKPEGIMNQWYVQLADRVIGPVSLEDLQQRVTAGQIPRESRVRQGLDGPWTVASSVPGLAASDGEAVFQPAPAASREQEGTVHRSPLALRPCSDCGKMVSQQANSCPNCGRWFLLNSLEVPYRGEQPIPVMAFFGLLAVLFLLATPVAVYFLAESFAENTIASEVARSRFAFLTAAAYLVSMVVCSALGGALGAPRMAHYTGLLLGLFFGPLGVFAAYAIDKRTQCPNCFSRLDGLARECPYCHVRLRWEQRPRWY